VKGFRNEGVGETLFVRCVIRYLISLTEWRIRALWVEINRAVGMLRFRTDFLRSLFSAQPDIERKNKPTH